MPLSRFQLRNEYGLGVRELYSEASKREDPKAVLDGVAVAGLVGLLRQLGDLAEFAAEVFHGLQEQMTNTASRSRKLMTRVKHVEAALPPLEKAMLSQTSHIQFAYTPGSEWHARIRNEQNHFTYTDLPHCIMDSYEECREPPRLQLLDKFDAGGPGSCLKRYSDPTFFRRVSGNSGILNYEKSKKERKARKNKKRRSRKRSSQMSYDTLVFDSSGRVRFSSPPRQRKSSPTQTVSTFGMTFKSDLVDRSDSPGSGDGMGFIECVFHKSASVQADETKTKQPFSGSGNKLMNNLESKYPKELTVVVNNDNPGNSILEKNAHRWNEKVEIVEPMVLNYGTQELPSWHETSSEFSRQEIEPTVGKSGNDEVEAMHEPTFQFDAPDIYPMGWNSRSYEVPKMQETNFEVDDLDIEPMGPFSGTNEMPEVHGNHSEFDDQELEPIGQHSGGIKKSEANLQHDEQEMEPETEESLNVLRASFEGMNSPNLIFNKDQADEIESETDNFVDALNTIESEAENDVDCQTKGEVELCSNPKDDLEEDMENEWNVDNIDDCSLEFESPSTSYNNMDKGKHESLNGSISSPLQACEESLLHTPASHDISGRDLCENPESLVSLVHCAEDATSKSMQSSCKVYLVDDLQNERIIRNTDDLSLESESPSTSYNDLDKEKCKSLNDSTSSLLPANIDDHSLESESPSTSYNDLDKEKCKSLNGSTSSLLPASEESLQHTPVPHDISGRELYDNPESSLSSVHSAEDAPLQSTQSSSIKDVSSRIDFSVHDDNANASHQESAAGGFSSSEYEATSTVTGVDEGLIPTPYVSEQPSVKSSIVGSFAFWTNGGLLGLQPSKPPDFSASDSVNTNNSITVCPYQNLSAKGDYLQGKPDSSANEGDYGNTNFEKPTTLSDNRDIDSSKEPSLPFSNSGLERKLNFSVDSDLVKSSDHSQSQLLPSVMHPEAIAHGAADARDTLNEAIHVNSERSSFFSGLGHGLLINGFRMSRSMEYDEKHSSVSCQKAHELENGTHVTLHRSFSGSNLTEELPSPLNSAPPSPPLEHMKISFHPINSFETSKLKLKYPEGIDHQDETLDAFPSFQLVPEPTLQCNIYSDSEDDIFCRSNTCMSDDELNHLSDSNSELWESGDSSESRDHITYNGLRRISTAESISSAAEQEEMTNRSKNNGFGSIHLQDKMGIAHASSSTLLDIPVLKPMNPFGFHEPNICNNPKSPMEAFDLREPTPEPPPLPPLQWRISKPQPDALDGKGSALNVMSSFSDSKNSLPAFPHPEKTTADDLLNTGCEHINVTTRKKHSDAEKLKVSVQEKIHQAVNVSMVDEKEDFLHQIRTKSINLRKTGLLKPTPAPVAPAANVKVTAILEKANAIRQAVASDEGEDDDPWSDT